MAPSGEFGKRVRPVYHESAALEVVFRIIHVALDDGLPPIDGSPPPSYREQAVEIALGPKGAFGGGNVGLLTRRVPPAQVVDAVQPPRRNARPPAPPKAPRTPRIAETLRKALEWRRLLDAGEVPNQAAIARREGITRARVTQVLDLLRLPPEIRSDLMAVQGDSARPCLAEHALRQIVRTHGLPA